MKKISLIILFIMPLFTYGKNIGVVKKVKGEVFYIKPKTILKVKIGDYIPENSIIRTGVGSLCYVQLFNGLLKYIPGSSKIIFSRKYIKRFLKTNNIEKLTVIGGEKAWERKSEDGWLDDSEPLNIKKNITNLYQVGNYFEVIKLFEKNKKLLTSFSNTIIPALSYYKVGYESRSIFYFKLLKKQNPKYELACYYGLFLNYVRLNNLNEANEYYQFFKQKFPNHEFFLEMKSIINEIKN